MRNALMPAALLLAASLIGACAATGPTAARASARLGPRADAVPVTLYVARRRWHIDVGFSVQDLPAPLAATALREFPHARYAFFGFGDRRYLLAKDHGAAVLLAALWPGPALILVTEIEAAPTRAFGENQVVALPLAPQQARAVQDFIWDSVAKDAGGTVSTYARGPYDGSAYFAAVPRYSGFHTCITWAAEALRSGGLPIRSRMTWVAGQLWRQVRKLQPPAAASAFRDGGPREAASITRRRVAVLANDGGAAALRDDDGGPGRRGRAAAADATGQQSGGQYRAE
jgi:uncharacterized protein (TIGR02117 family)